MATNSGPSAQQSIEDLEKEQDSEGLDLAQATKEDRDLYLKMRLRQYNKHNLQDLNLQEQYREDFTGWSIRYFQATNPHSIRNLRITLRTHGVQVGRSNGRSLSEALFNTLNEEHTREQSKEEITKHINVYGEFKSGKIAWLIKSGGVIKFGLPNTPTRALSPLLRSTSPTVTAKDSARDITNLAKLYSGNNQKYGGHNDNFDFHLTIFNTRYSQVGIQDDATKAKAYPIMLKEQALDYHFTNLQATKNTTVSFTELCNGTRNYFETVEYRRS